MRQLRLQQRNRFECGILGDWAKRRPFGLSKIRVAGFASAKAILLERERIVTHGRADVLCEKAFILLFGHFIVDASKKPAFSVESHVRLCLNSPRRMS